MGLTFQQSFYHADYICYAVYEQEHQICAIIKKPEDKDEDMILQVAFKAAGYILQPINISELVDDGIKLTKKIEADI